MRRAQVVVGVLVLLLGLAGVVSVPGTSGRLTGKIAHPTSTARTAVYGSTSSCAAAAVATGAYFVYPLAEASGPAATDAAGNTARNGTYTSGGVTYAAQGPCPRDGFRAVTLDGSTGYVESPATPAWNTLSVQVWFRTTTTSGGRLAGYGSGGGLLGNASLTYDRHLYMRNDGHLVFGVLPTLATYRTIATTTALNDGAWHHAVGVLGPGGMSLYVDGSPAGSLPGTTTAQGYLADGRWRFGFDSLDGWPGAPSSRYFSGRLASAAVWNAALTSSQVATLHSAGR